jgi:uncharacterized membrane protein YgcG
MKSFLQIIFLSIVGLFPYEKAFAQYDLYTERILNFHSDLVVDSLSNLTVTEKIRVNALGVQIQRGIFRVLPNQRNIQEKTFYVKYKILSVKRDGKEEDYHTRKENGNFVIYIGNKDVNLDRGIYEYELTYETRNQIGFFEDFDELYWNVNGNYWVFPIDQISATVHLPDGSKIIQNACYKGVYRSSTQDCSVEILSKTSLKWSAKKLSPAEGLTIAIGIEKGLIQEPVIPFYLKKENLMKILGGILGVLLVYFAIQWYRFGIDPPQPTIIPLFHPPRNLSPASMGYLYNGKYSNKYLTAAIVNLAVKGYLKITEIDTKKLLGLLNKKSYKITKIKSEHYLLSEEEISVLNNISGSLTIDGEYDSNIYSMVVNFQEKIKSKHQKLLHSGNNRKKVILPFLLISLVYFFLLFSAYIHLYNDGKFIIGCILYVVLFVIYTIILSVPTLRYISFWVWIIPLAPLLVFVGIYLLYKSLDAFDLAYLFLSGSLFLLTLFKYLVEKPHIDLIRIKSEIEGFKMYLTTAESKLLQYHNHPNLTPKVFEKLLPYAIILGVDDIWGEKFGKLLEQNNMEYKSSWYTGSYHGFTSSFSSTFGKSFTSTIVSSSTTPSSSGSGSGGGGFSGGGGGGGGGGGW